MLHRNHKSYIPVRNWNEPQGSCQAWVISVDGEVDARKGYSSKSKAMAAIKKMKSRGILYVHTNQV